MLCLYLKLKSLTTKMTPPGGELYWFFVIEASLNFSLTYAKKIIAKYLHIFDILGVVRYRSFAPT